MKHIVATRLAGGKAARCERVACASRLQPYPYVRCQAMATGLAAAVVFSSEGDRRVMDSCAKDVYLIGRALHRGGYQVRTDIGLHSMPYRRRSACLLSQDAAAFTDAIIALLRERFMPQARIFPSSPDCSPDGTGSVTPPPIHVCHHGSLGVFHSKYRQCSKLSALQQSSTVAQP